MPRIINPFHGQDPIAQTISQLGQTMFGGSLSRDLQSQQLLKAQRENTETGNLSNLTSQKGAAALASSPIAQAMIIASGYKPEDFGKLGLLQTATTQGAAAPATQNFQVGTGQPFDNTADAVRAKLAEVMRNNDLQSADRRYGVDQTVGENKYEFNTGLAETTRNNDLQSADRRYGVDQTQGENRFEFNNKPQAAIGADGQPTFTTQGDLTGFSPILSNTEVQGTTARQLMATPGGLAGADPTTQNYLGADGTSKTPHNYVSPDGQTHITYDGVTDAQTGQPLPSGGYVAGVQGSASDAGVTNSVQSQLQNQVAGANSFIQSIDAMQALTDDPSNFGLIGSLRAGGQEAMQAGNALLQKLGGDAAVRKAAEAAATAAAQSGINPAAIFGTNYDPKLPAIQMLGGVLIYQGASVLAGQENRSISDKDVSMMKQIIGDPMGLFESAQSIKVKLAIAKAMAQNHLTLAQQYLKNGMAPAADGSLPGVEEQALTQAIQQVTGQQGAPNLPDAAAPPASGQPGQAEEGDTVQGPDGKTYKVVNGQLVPQ